MRPVIHKTVKNMGWLLKQNSSDILSITIARLPDLNGDKGFILVRLTDDILFRCTFASWLVLNEFINRRKFRDVKKIIKE